LGYLQALLSASVVAISKAAWDKDRAATSSVEKKERRMYPDTERTIHFWRSVSLNHRLRMEGKLALDNFAMEVFTTDAWD
jgi:hypothetical protein